MTVAHEVRCPSCGSQAGSRCTANGHELRVPHLTRMRTAVAVDEEAIVVSLDDYDGDG